MNYKELGQTHVRIPEIGMGTWQYEGGVEPLQRGLEQGAYLIDTAEDYGTEDTVGRAVRGIRHQVFIATKVSPKHFKHADLLMAADRSLRQLGTEYIDLYQLHRPNEAVPIEETMAAMEELVDQGKVRFIGVSNFSVVQLQRAQAVLAKYRIVSNQVRYSLVDRRIEKNLLPYCQKNRVTVISYSPLARGLQNIKRKRRSGILSSVAAITRKTEAQVALNWCVSKEAVIGIPKAQAVEHVVENCGASGWQLSADQIRLLEENFRRPGPVEVALRQVARRILDRLG